MNAVCVMVSEPLRVVMSGCVTIIVSVSGVKLRVSSVVCEADVTSMSHPLLTVICRRESVTDALPLSTLIPLSELSRRGMADSPTPVRVTLCVRVVVTSALAKLHPSVSTTLSTVPQSEAVVSVYPSVRQGRSSHPHVGTSIPVCLVSFSFSPER